MLLGLAVLLAGCGGGGGEQSERLSGPGFSFAAPKGWAVERGPSSVTARAEGGALVSVLTLPLRRAYRPELWPRVVPELDRVAREFAMREEGSVRSARTVAVAGRRARQYEIAAEDVRERLTFVLVRRTEFQLLCRWPADEDEPAACAELAASFRTR